MLRDTGDPARNLRNLQAAIDLGCDVGLKGHRYPVDDIVFIHGHVDLFSREQTELVLVGQPSQDQFVNLGVTEFGQMGAPWSGTMEGLRVTSEHDLRIGVSMHHVSGCQFRNCVFDFRSATVKNGVKGLNQFPWTGPGPVRTNVTMRDCEIVANQSLATGGGEAFGISDGSDVVIEDCLMHGWLDDSPGIHFCERATIRRLNMKSVMGRIGFFNVVDGTAEDCDCERIPGADGVVVPAGGLIYSIPDDNLNPAIPRAVPRRTKILNCRLKLPQGLPSFTFGIRLLGIQRCEVRGNVIENNSPNGHTAIRIEPVLNRPEWQKLPTDIEGDPDGESWPRDHVIRDNRTTGLHPGDIGPTGMHVKLPGPFTVWDNVASGFNNWPTHSDLQRNEVIE